MQTTFLEADQIADGTVFTKSSRSGAAGHCVETAPVPGGVALRHSRAQKRGAFLFTEQEMAAFIEGVKAGDFDHHLL